jgi:hypothetical protein
MSIFDDLQSAAGEYLNAAKDKAISDVLGQNATPLPATVVEYPAIPTAVVQTVKDNSTVFLMIGSAVAVAVVILIAKKAKA